MMNSAKIETMSLVLSGGGIRAMVFHLGVLRRLAELGVLERVTRLSTVSGGSLVAGLIFRQSALRWPTSSQFLEDTYPSLRDKLCDRSLVWGAVRQLSNPLNWRFAISRANLLARALTAEWGINCSLGDLPATPEWSINGTTAENGKRFRFKREDFGDYELGYASSAGFPLANALAVSAAFPLGFGPFVIDTRSFRWRTKPWADVETPTKFRAQGYARLHLYDGGIYDNLGLEPFFDAGRQKVKRDAGYIIVSDAGARLERSFAMGPFNPFRMKRVADIMSDQSRALRVRAFMNYILGAPSRGAFIPIGEPMKAESLRTTAEFAMSFPTTLKRLTADQFDSLVSHGYEVTRQVEDRFGLRSIRAD